MREKAGKVILFFRLLPPNIGKNKGFWCKTEQDIVVEGRNFPLFPRSFQHSTFPFHIGCGKEPQTPGFNNPFTLHPQTGGNPNPLFPPELFRVFHNFPTPYYGYYNKFNK